MENCTSSPSLVGHVTSRVLWATNMYFHINHPISQKPLSTASWNRSCRDIKFATPQPHHKIQVGLAGRGRYGDAKFYEKSKNISKCYNFVTLRANNAQLSPFVHPMILNHHAKYEWPWPNSQGHISFQSLKFSEPVIWKLLKLISPNSH